MLVLWLSYGGWEARHPIYAVKLDEYIDAQSDDGDEHKNCIMSTNRFLIECMWFWIWIYWPKLRTTFPSQTVINLHSNIELSDSIIQLYNVQIMIVTKMMMMTMTIIKCSGCIGNGGDGMMMVMMMMMMTMMVIKCSGCIGNGGESNCQVTL